ncbi:MAG TPA: DUF4344 domain-containing metallopeptidase [Burkholderiales bacterium]|nr:DUF4344 domain-containing metallopeptidase [Burkholderiales bacterium]
MCSNSRKAAIALIAVCAALLSTQAFAKKPPVLKSNRIDISYAVPPNPAHQQIYELLKERRVLERFQAYLSALRLPTTLILKSDGCDGESNAWYEESDHTVTVCYEYLDDVLKNAPETTTPAGVTRQDAIVGPAVEVFLHEVGHAIFNLLKVPILGREEDAADQVADYLILHLDDDIARQVVTGVGYMYAHEMQSQTPGLQQFANVHGLSAQRFYNLLCMAYGKDPKLFGDVVERGYLPESRAESCEDEYKQVDYAFKKLIYPYIDQAVVKKVQPKKLMRPVEK